MKIQIAGPGCPKCKAMEEIVHKVCNDDGSDDEIEHLTNPADFAKLGVMFTPALIVDGKVVVSGHVPSEGEVRKFLGK